MRSSSRRSFPTHGILRFHPQKGRLLSSLPHIVLLLMFLSAFTMTKDGYARANPGSYPVANRAGYQPDSDPISVTILDLDMSGSMSTNDSGGYRCSAANAFIDLSRPGNFIGVVGLDSNGDRGGPHQFQLAQVWALPREMQTLGDRQDLQRLIASKSRNCRPDNTTPTYDSLNESLKMLAAAPHGGDTKESVLLLTDGVPDPDTLDQINAINKDLIPQFKQNHWSIDTIALGVDGPISGSTITFHKFLSGLSDATGGQFYDTINTIVPGLSPLNIAPFFVDIFRRYNNRTVSRDIPATAIDGIFKRNFNVTAYTNSLDVIVVKDQPGIAASLKTPDGRVISQSGDGVYDSSSDPYYEIFSIDHPQPGSNWELDMTGTGNFLMDSLKVSGIGLSINEVSQQAHGISLGSHLALGIPMTVTASLANNGQKITDGSYTLSGTITFKGASGTFDEDFALDDKGTSGVHTGNYLGSVDVPLTAPAGSYDIQINASTISLDNVVTSRDQTVSMGKFPAPYFLSPQGIATKSDATVIVWDPYLRWLYLNVDWLFHWVRPWALQNLSLDPYGVVSGQIELDGHVYNGATVSATAIQTGSNTKIPIKVNNDDKGHFRILFPPALDGGDYTLTFKTSGTFEDSHGDLGITTRIVRLIVSSPTVEQEIMAWLISVVFFLLCLGILILATVMLRRFIFNIGRSLILGEDGKKQGKTWVNESASPIAGPKPRINEGGNRIAGPKPRVHGGGSRITGRKKGK